MITRRTLLQGSAAAVAIAAPPTITRADETLTVAAYGGEYQDIFTETTIKPFEKKFSCKVIYETVGGNAQTYARIRASRGAPGFDVIAELTASFNFLADKEKLFEPVTEKTVPNIKDYFDRAKTLMPANGIIPSFQYVALIHNPKEVKRPESWMDYWDPVRTYGERIKGHVLAHGMGNFELCSYAMIMGAKAKGGDERNMTEAWKLLKVQKPYLAAVVDTSAAAVPYMENGQVWIGSYWSARSVYYMKRGLPISMTVPKEGTVALVSSSSVPVGAKNKRLGLEFLNFRLDPEIQRNFSLAYNSSPSRPLTDLPAEYVEQQITTNEKLNSYTFPDVEYIASQVRPWTEAWQDAMA